MIIPKPVRHLAHLLSAATIAVTVVTAPTATAQQVPAAPAVTWEECPDVVVAAGARCGRTDAPLHHDAPAGEKISVGFVRLPATESRRGTIFYNPGGPGGSSYAYVGAALQWPESIRAHYDIVGVQPRGMTGSTPLVCTQELAAGADDDNATQEFTQSDIEELLQPGKAMREDCGWDYATTLTTRNLASDWETVRQGLGLEKISVAGMSYGTILASTYATEYPDHTDRVILDSGIDPHAMWTTAFTAQPPVYLANLNRFFQWVADNDATYHMGTTPLQVYRGWTMKIAAEAGAPPSIAPPPAQGEDIPVGIPNELFDAYVKADATWSNLTSIHGSQANSLTLILTRMILPSSTAWPFLASLISNQVADFDPVKMEEILSTNDSFMDMAVVGVIMQCNENQVPADPRLLGPFAWEALITQNVFWMGALALGSGFQCAGAPPVAQVPELTGAALTVRPLQIQGTHDPQTPYHLWGGMAQSMNSQVLTVDGWDHGYFAVGNAEVDAVVAHYLATGQLSQSTLQLPLPPARIVSSLDDAL